MSRQTYCTRTTILKHSYLQLKNNRIPKGTRGAIRLTTVFLILSLSTVVLSIATEDARDAATGVGAFKLTWQTHMDVWKQEDNKQKRTWVIEGFT